MKKLLVTGAFPINEKYIDDFSKMGYKVFIHLDEKEDLSSELYNVDTIICNNLFKYTEICKFNNLKVIQLTSAGIDRVPLDYIIRNNITLYNAKDVYSVPIAEWVILKLLEIYKNTRFFVLNQISKKWIKNRDIIELNNKKILIMGLGNIGLEIAKRLKAFGCYVYGYDIKSVSSEYIDKQLNVTKIDQYITLVDVVIIALPLNESTKHIIDYNRLMLMKNDAVIINVSRGGLIHESALIELLKNDKFRGVALDVFENEPLSNSSYLWENERVIISPHNSYVSECNSSRLFELTKKNIGLGGK